QFMLILGLAYFTATVHVTFRDTQYLLGVGLQLFMFLSPVFYDPAAIPKPWQPLYHMNPMVNLMDAYRAVLIRGEFPEGRSLLSLALPVMILLSAGYLVFRRASKHFVDEL